MVVSSASLSSRLVCLVIVFGVFSLASAGDNSEVALPPGYTAFETIGVAYKVHTNRLDWDAARRACMNENAHLAIIDTMEKVGYIKNMKGPGVYVWTGISRTDSSSGWVSSDSGTAMPNFPWAPGKPAGPHNCIAIRGCNRGLTNESCTNRLGFVCQIPLESAF